MQILVTLVLAAVVAFAGVGLTLPQTADAASFCSVADINRDRVVDDADYQILVGNFGLVGRRIQGDLDYDGDVDIYDYNTMVAEYGTDCRIVRPERR